MDVWWQAERKQSKFLSLAFKTANDLWLQLCLTSFIREIIFLIGVTSTSVSLLFMEEVYSLNHPVEQQPKHPARLYCQLGLTSEKINSVLKIICILHEVNVWCNPRNKCCIRSWGFAQIWSSGWNSRTVAAIWVLSYSCFHLLAAKGMQQWWNHVGTWRIQAVSLVSIFFSAF